MQWKPDGFSEYSESPQEIDYAHPAYYQQDTLQGARSAQTGEPALMSEYRGPASLQEYVAGPETERQEAAGADGSAEASKSRKRKGLAGLGGIGALLAALLKLQWVVYLAKFGFAGLTAVISIFAYSLIFGWTFAIGLVILLFIHEMGHALVMKLKGIPIGGMVFIPLLGAAVFMRKMPRNAKDEAEVGIAGPIAGTLASSVCLLLAMQPSQQQTIWAPLAYFGFFINLFNLIPIVPFDGGRVLAAIDRRVWTLGFLGLVAFAVWSWMYGNFSPWLLLFIIMAGAQFWSRRHVPDTPEGKAYYSVPLGERIILGLVYFGLAAVLILGMSISHGMILPVAS